MAKKKEKMGFLTSSMKKFLKMSENDRRKKYGYDVNKMYERIVNRMDNSFWDMIYAYDHLPQKQRNKIDLVQHYQNVVEHITRNKLTEKTPTISLITTRNQLKAVMEQYINKDEKLKKIARPLFVQALDWLDYIDQHKPSYEMWHPEEEPQYTPLT